jgi:hypothetical protein
MGFINLMASVATLITGLTAVYVIAEMRRQRQSGYFPKLIVSGAQFELQQDQSGAIKLRGINTESPSQFKLDDERIFLYARNRKLIPATDQSSSTLAAGSGMAAFVLAPNRCQRCSRSSCAMCCSRIAFRRSCVAGCAMNLTNCLHSAQSRGSYA